MSEDLTYSSLHEMMMKKFKFESNSQINLSFKLSSFDFNVDITDDAEIRTIRNYLRPVLMIDAVHLKGLYKGTNLVVVAMNGNNQIVPIALGFKKAVTTAIVSTASVVTIVKGLEAVIYYCYGLNGINIASIVRYRMTHTDLDLGLVHAQFQGKIFTTASLSFYCLNSFFSLCAMEGLGSTSGIRACALRNFDIEDIIKKKSFTHKEEMDPMALSYSKVAKFEKSAKDLDQLLGSQITDNSKKGLGYSAVPLPHPLILNRPTPLDLSYSGLDEFKEPEFKEWVSDNEDEVESPVVVKKKTVIPTAAKIEKPVRKPYTCKHKRHVNGQREEKPVWKNTRRVDDHYSTRMTHSNPRRNIIPQAVLMRSGIKAVNTAKPKNAHNAVKRNSFNTVKASACWVWMPKNRVIDHGRNNAQIDEDHFGSDGCTDSGEARVQQRKRRIQRRVQQKQKDQEDEVFGRILSAKKMKTIEELTTAGYRVTTAGSRLLLLVRKLMLLKVFLLFQLKYHQEELYIHKEEMAPMALSDSKQPETGPSTQQRWTDGAGFDWSDMAEEEIQENMALMAFSDSEEIALHKRSVRSQEYQWIIRTELEKVKEEKEGFEFKIAKFEKSAKDLDQLLASQITDKSKKGFGYNVKQEVSGSSTSSQQDQDCIVMPIWKDASYFGNDAPRSVADAQYKIKIWLQDENDATEKSHEDSSLEDNGTLIRYLKNLVGPSHASEDTQVEFQGIELGNIPQSYTGFYVTSYKVSLCCWIGQRYINAAIYSKILLSAANSSYVSVAWFKGKLIAQCLVEDEDFVKRLRSTHNQQYGFGVTIWLMLPMSKLVNAAGEKVNAAESLLVVSTEQPETGPSTQQRWTDGAGFDWSDMAEEEIQENMALMAFSDSEEIALHKRSVRSQEYQWIIRTELEKVKEEKEGFEFKIAKFEKSAKDLDQLLASQITDKSKKGFGYNVKQEVSGSSTSSQQDQDCIVMPIWKDASYFGNDAPRSVADAQYKIKIWLQDENDATEKSHEDSSLEDNGTLIRYLKNLVGPSHASEDTQVEFQGIELGNIPQSYTVPTTPHTIIYKDHPIDHVIGDVQSSVQTRRMTSSYFELGFLSDIYEGKTHKDLHTCLLACFLSQED
ncbi:hypothetical protein Tco_0516413 [Tanacetum coccineum]